MPQVRRMGYLLTALLAVALLTAMTWKPALPPRYTGIPQGAVPAVLTGYASVSDPVAPSVRAALSSADIVSRNYTQGAGAINFLLIGGTDRTALHDPRSCLVGAGWSLQNDHVETLPGTQTVARSCRAVGLPGVPGYDIIYLYVDNGRVINNVTQVRAAMLWSALIGRKNTPVYFLRFMRPLDADPVLESANHARMAAFASQMWTALTPTLIRKS
jgi:hypothetical protein